MSQKNKPGKKQVKTRVKNPKLIDLRRRQIIKGAIQVFTAKGFHAATVREIADSAGLTMGSLYNYIRSKEDIIYMVYDYITKILKDTVRMDRDHLTIKMEGDTEEVFDLNEVNKIFLVGTGKASSSMALAIEEIFGDRITKGVITTKYGHLLPLKKTEVIEAGHPLPDQKGYQGAKKIQRLLKQSGPKDLVIFLLSGGGSALLPFPAADINLKEKQEVTQLLLDCGADIKQINTIRKHISRVKGGWLARWAFPSTVLGFILSDVVGDQLDVIGSGPTVPDPSTFEEAWEILKKYDLLNEVAPTIQKHLRLGKEGKVEETPKPGEDVFEKVSNNVIGSNILALLAAEKE